MTQGPVLLHGFAGSAASWEPVVAGLRAAGHDPVALDLPGHGTRAGEADPARFVLPRTLADVAGAAPWPNDLIGYSLGGRVALHFAAAFPDRVRRLVLESASPGLATAGERAERRTADAQLARSILGRGIGAFVDAWEALPLFASHARLEPAVRDRLRRIRMANAPESLAAALGGLGTGALPSLWDRLGEITVPTLLLAGADDAKFVDVARRAAERLPDARVVVVPECGHTVHLERPDAWAETVVRFLG